MRGHSYVKSAIDVACWDILGKASRVCRSRCCWADGMATIFLCIARFRKIRRRRWPTMVGEYRKQGYTKFQLKVGGDVETDIGRIFAAAEKLKPGDILIADANTGWTQHQALRVADAARVVDVYIEQPCRTYEECLAVRRKTARPFILDEVIDDVGMVVRGAGDHAMDVINLKISKVGGLTPARRDSRLMRFAGHRSDHRGYVGRGHRDGGHRASGAFSTPPEFLFTTTDFNSYVTVSTAEGAPQRVNGRMTTFDRPGLGIEPRMEVLGRPVVSVG